MRTLGSCLVVVVVVGRRHLMIEVLVLVLVREVGVVVGEVMDKTRNRDRDRDRDQDRGKRRGMRSISMRSILMSWMGFLGLLDGVGRSVGRFCYVGLARQRERERERVPT